MKPKKRWIKDKRYIKFIKSLLVKKPILDVGCGYEKMGDVGIDIINYEDVDIRWNLNKFPYPIKSNSFSTILCHHVIEHVKYPAKTLKELHRILKPNGRIVIVVPHPNHPTYRNPSHLHFFVEKSICDLVSKYFKIEKVLKWKGTEWMPFPIFVHKLLGIIHPSQIICIGKKV